MDNQQPTPAPKQQPQQPPVNTSIEPTKVKKPSKLPIILMTVVTLLSLATSGYLAYQNYLLNQQMTEFKSSLPTLEDKASTTTAATPTVLPTTDPTVNWKEYYHDKLDIKFKYPEDWIIETNYYLGGAFLNGKGACEFIFEYRLSYIKNKDPLGCSDPIIKTYNPGLTIKSPDMVNILQFAGPTDGLGGGCELCVQNIPTILKVKDRYYTIDTYTNPHNNVEYETIIGPAKVEMQAGNKSKWNYFDIYLRAADKTILDKQIQILESIE